MSQIRRACKPQLAKNMRMRSHRAMGNCTGQWATDNLTSKGTVEIFIQVYTWKYNNVVVLSSIHPSDCTVLILPVLTAALPLTYASLFLPAVRWRRSQNFRGEHQLLILSPLLHVAMVRVLTSGVLWQNYHRINFVIHLPLPLQIMAIRFLMKVRCVTYLGGGSWRKCPTLSSQCRLSYAFRVHMFHRGRCHR